MEKVVIQTSQYKIPSLTLIKNELSYIASDNLSSVYQICNIKTLSFGELIAFMVDYSVKFQEEETDMFNEYMLSNYKIIKFYDVKYYMPLHNFNDKEQKIYDYLIENYSCA